LLVFVKVEKLELIRYVTNTVDHSIFASDTFLPVFMVVSRDFL